MQTTRTGALDGLMDRRALLLLLGRAAVTWPLAAQGQQRAKPSARGNRRHHRPRRQHRLLDRRPLALRPEAIAQPMLPSPAPIATRASHEPRPRQLLRGRVL